MEPLVIRPNRRVFVVRPVMWTAILLGLVELTAYLILILNQIETLGGLWVLVYVAIVGTVAGLRHVRYGKTSYTLMADRVVHRTGGLFSEATRICSIGRLHKCGCVCLSWSIASLGPGASRSWRQAACCPRWSSTPSTSRERSTIRSGQ